MSNFLFSRATSSYVLPAAAAIALASSFTVMTSSPSAAAGSPSIATGYHKVCAKHVDTGSGRWRSKSKAAWAARAKWRYVVKKHDGVTWAIWRLARGKTKKCWKKWYGWKCRYQAKACRFD